MKDWLWAERGASAPALVHAGRNLLLLRGESGTEVLRPDKGRRRERPDRLRTGGAGACRHIRYIEEDRRSAGLME